MSSQTVFVTAGKTSFSIDVNLVQKAAATSPGDPITGLAYNTSSLTAYYRINGTGTSTAITLATQTATGAFSSGGFVEISSTNEPGAYRFDVPNAVIATAGFAKVVFNGAANMATHTVYFVVMAVDLFTNAYLPANVTYWNSAVLAGGTGPIPELGILERGTAQSATSTTLVGRAATTDDIIEPGMILWAYGSTQGYWQTVMIDSVSGDTFTVAAWPNATPSGTITYIVYGVPQVSVNVPIAADVRKFGGTAGTFASGIPAVNAAQISGDSVAADNAESFFDGTGYAGTNNVIPVVTTVNGLAANVITAAATAADFTTEVTAGLSTLTAAGVRTAVGLASANLDTQIAAIQADTDNIQTRIPAALVSGRMDVSVGAMAADVLTAAAIASNAFDADAFATDAATEVATAVWASATRTLTAGTNITIPTAAQVADAVWDEALSGHLTAGSTGEALNAAGAAGDPWTTTLPGTYSAGQAGYLIGQNLNATVSSRASQVSVDAVQTKTDQLTFTKTNELDANIQSVNGATVTGNGNSQSWSGE